MWQVLATPVRWRRWGGTLLRVSARSSGAVRTLIVICARHFERKSVSYASGEGLQIAGVDSEMRQPAVATGFHPRVLHFLACLLPVPHVFSENLRPLLRSLLHAIFSCLTWYLQDNFSTLGQSSSSPPG